MTTFQNFAVRIETGWATRVVKPILKIGSAIRNRFKFNEIQTTITWGKAS